MFVPIRTIWGERACGGGMSGAIAPVMTAGIHKSRRSQSQDSAKARSGRLRLVFAWLYFCGCLAITTRVSAQDFQINTATIGPDNKLTAGNSQTRPKFSN
jgi:hypothetical protein